jgi:hypothetical protein
MYIPSKLFVSGNATATVGNIAAHEQLFRLGIVADLAAGIVLIFFNVVNDAGVLIFVRGADYLSVFDKPQRDALGMLFLRLHDQATTGAEILWGLWLLPLALLVYRSRFLPRFLGVWLVINGFAYVIISLTGLLLPQYQGRVFTISLPALLGELALMFWLVIKGARPQPLSTAGSSLAAVSV